MEGEHYQRKNRIKLRVLTSTGLNLLCTANRSQKVKQLLPHIIKLYQQVKQDQGLTDEFQLSSTPFIKFVRKQEFLIAPSELVGDIFDQNDEVFCQIANDINFNIKKGTKIQKKQQKQQKLKGQQKVKNQPELHKTKKIKKQKAKNQNEKFQKQNNQPQKKQSSDVNNQSLSQKLVKKFQQINKKPKNEQIIKGVQKKIQQSQLKPQKQCKEKQKQQKIIKVNQHQQLLPETKQNRELNKNNKRKSKKNKEKNNQNQNKQKIQFVARSSSAKTHQPTHLGSPLISTDEMVKFKMMMRRSSSNQDEVQRDN